MRQTITFVVAFVVALFSVSSLAFTEVSLQPDSNKSLVMDGIPEIPEDIVNDLKLFQQIHPASVLGWDEMGEALYILKRSDSVSQIHRVDSPGAAPHKLTHAGEPVRGALPRPAHSDLLFSRDTGGNERSQLYLLNPLTGNTSPLTDGVSLNTGAIWDHQGSRIAYQSTVRNGRDLDILVMNPEAPQDVKTVFKPDDGSSWVPIEFSKAGNRILLWRYASDSDSQAYILDLESGQQNLLVDHSGVNKPIGFDADQSGFWFITDAKGEFTQIAYMGFGEGSSPRFLTSDINWDIERAVLSHNKQRMVFVVNENGMSRLYLMDTSSGQHQVVKGIADGQIAKMAFSPDDRKLAITLKAAKTPGDCFVLKLDDTHPDSNNLTRWTSNDVTGLDSSTFIAPKLIHFPTFDRVNGESRKIPAWLYKPASEGPHPVIISIHGGPASQARPVFNPEFQSWLHTLGVALIVPNVRGSRGYGKHYLSLDDGKLRENSVRDIGSLLDWVRTQPYLDENRIALHGVSYGGYMVLASAVLYSDQLKAAVDAVGISNFVSFLEGTGKYRQDMRRKEYGDERDPKMRSFLNSISPLNHVSDIRIPTFIIQGQNDPRVPAAESKQMVEALRRQNVSVWYMNAMNEGHGFKKKENLNIRQQAITLFFLRYLLDEAAVPLQQGMSYSRY